MREKLLKVFLFVMAFIALLPFKIKTYADEEQKMEIGFMLMSDKNEPVLNRLAFELEDSKGKKTRLDSESSLVNMEVDINGSYTLRLKNNDTYEMEDLKFIVGEEGPHKDGEAEIIYSLVLKTKEADTSESEAAFDSIIVKTYKGDEILKDSPFRLFRVDGIIPNMIRDNIRTDENGEYELTDFQPKKKYIIAMENNSLKFNIDRVSFKTDANARVVEINEKKLKSTDNNEIKFVGHAKDSDKLKTTEVKIKVVYEENGEPAEGVELTANTLIPKLSSYKNAKSDSEGYVTFNLEGQKGGRIYTLCVSKNGQFLWKFKPEQITIYVDDEGKVTVDQNAELLFEVKKEDRSYLRQELEDKIKAAQKYLSENTFTNQAAVKELKDIITVANEELAKPETIPYYVEGFIKSIDEARANLEKYKKTDNASSFQIVRVDPEEQELGAEGGKVTITLFTSGKPDKSLIKMKAIAGSSEENFGDFKVEGEKAKKTLTFTVPANTSSEAKNYTLKFNATGSTEDFQETPVAKIKVAAAEGLENGTIEQVRVDKPELPAEGGKTSFTVKGKNLKNGVLSLKVYKIEGANETEQPEISAASEFQGTDRVQTAFITFPPAAEETQYLIKTGFNSVMTHEVRVKVGTKLSNETTVINPSIVYIDKTGKVITLRFDEEIFAVNGLENLKKAVSIAQDGENFEALKTEDKIEINENKIIINLNTGIAAENNAKIRFKERAIKDKLERDNKPFDFIIRKNNPVIEKAEFIKGESLDFNGGEVELKLSGHDLSDTQVKISKNEKLHNKNDDIAANILKESDTEQIIKFALPKNEASRVQTYTVQISLDGGRTYKSDFASTIYDRTKRLVCAVLPEGADASKPALGFMSIQSYGTSGGGTETPDITHTNTPINQESKKTFVYVYGTNLDSKLTKVKIVDKNGIEWTPLNEAGSDSFSQFIMIGFNHTGIDGNGNNQMLEIICPNNIAGDNTFKYLIAVDGVNFDEEVYVTATVIDDKSGLKNELTENKIKNIRVTYTDEAGNTIAPEKYIRGYEWAKAVAFNINPEKIEGYTQVRYRIGKKNEESLIWKGEENLDRYDALYLREADEVNFVYKSNNSQGAGKEEQNPSNKDNNQGQNDNASGNIIDNNKEQNQNNNSGNTGDNNKNNNNQNMGSNKNADSKNNNQSRGSSGSSSGGSSSRSVVKVVNQPQKEDEGAWLSDAKGWWYKLEDGSWPAAKWLHIKYNNQLNWYYFNAEGYMATGWINWNNNWYYLDESGVMLADTVTPDGYRVDAQGAWIK